MTVSRLSALVLILIALEFGASRAVALDAPHSLHRAKPESRLTLPHRATGRHEAAHGAKPAATHTAPATARTTSHAAPTTHAAPSREQAHLTVRGTARANTRRVSVTGRRHGSYERFTASSFAVGAIGAGDVTEG